jgi:hypothetical protein
MHRALIFALAATTIGVTPLSAAAESDAKSTRVTRTLDPAVEYVDKVVGSATAPDLARVREDSFSIALANPPTPDYPVIEVNVTHVLRAGVARADVVERTTTWTAGQFNAWNAFWTPVSIVDPFFWLDKDVNPIALSQHVAAEQRIKRVMKFIAAPVPDLGSGVEDFSAPASHVQLFLDAGARGASAAIVETDKDGHWQGSVADILRQLQVAPSPTQPPQPIRIQILATSGAGKPLILEIPAALQAANTSVPPQ